MKAAGIEDCVEGKDNGNTLIVRGSDRCDVYIGRRWPIYVEKVQGSTEGKNTIP